MNDTSKETLVRFQNMIMKRKPIERLLMGFSMYDTARQIVLSSIKAQNSKLSANRIREKLFLWFYGNEFTETQKKKIIKTLIRV